jgi:hypothetical protein
VVFTPLNALFAWKRHPGLVRVPFLASRAGSCLEEHGITQRDPRVKVNRELGSFPNILLWLTGIPIHEQVDPPAAVPLCAGGQPRGFRNKMLRASDSQTASITGRITSILPDPKTICMKE